MSQESIARHRDPRTVLVQDKFFSLRPQPLEQWLWKQAIPAAAERVFWVHWEAGMRAGDWCSQIPIRLVAARCCLDPSTVTRAYQVLGRLGLLRREDPGRDPGNPFQQATAVTEVRLPRELLVEMDRSPNRSARRPDPPRAEAVASPIPAAAPPAPAAAPNQPPGHLKFRDYQRIQGKFSAAEKVRYREAWEQGRETMAFDPDSSVSALEQAHICWQLHLQARPPVVEAPRPVATPNARPGNAFVGPRRLTVLEAARLRRRIGEVVATAEAAEAFRQVLWSVEEGALRRFEVAHAINIAAKKLRAGEWTRPNRMPPNWMRGEVLRAAVPESCVAA
jgi:hypothetical protein